MTALARAVGSPKYDLLQPMPDPLPFGRWMKRLRADLDLTQEALAEAAGCAVQTIRTIENGTRRPSRDMAERLADVLHVTDEQRADFVHLARTSRQPRPTDPATMEQGHPWVAQGSAPDKGAPGVTQGVPSVLPAPILATKLYVPRPRAQLVARPRLLARLDAGLAEPLTLIAAPAGFGKTTLLAEWLSQKDPNRLTVAWLTLEAGESDPPQFMRYLIAALQTIAPALGSSVLPLLGTAQAPPIETLMPLLINDLVRLLDASILVLDDYHLITAPAVHQALTFLLDHLPPQLHLVLASRVDPPLPLPRLRARGQLTELRAQDLRFTPEEAAMFLQGVMNLPVTVEDIAALETRTEGWIAGLQFAALAMRDRTDLRSFVHAFTGSHRFVVDYLVDEVLARQPPPLQSFLLQTSILERLCGPLCDAVVVDDERGGTDSKGMGEQAQSQQVLEELEHANLFIIPLDDARRWYRYHHLFAEVLRERLTSGTNQDRVTTLHRRASAWFEQHGLVVEAVQHALAACDWATAGHLIEEHGRGLMLNGHIQTVRGWLRTLPDAVLRASPYLYLLDALGLFFANELEAAEHRLYAAETSLSTSTSDDRSRSILGYGMVIRASIARYRGDLSRCISLAQQALELLPATDVSARMPAEVHLAQGYLLSGDVSPTNERLVAEHVARLRASGELTGIFYAIVTLAGLQRRQGRLQQAAARYREAYQVASASGGPGTLVNGAAYYFGLGDLLREWNHLDTAANLLLQGRKIVLGVVATQAETLALGHIALARLQQAQGDSRGAITILDELEQVARQRNIVPQMIARGAAARGHLALLQDDLSTAVRWADTSGLQVDDDFSYVHEHEYLVLVRVRIAQGRSDPAGPYLRDALYLLARLQEAAETGARMNSVIEILALRALALHAQGDLHQALGTLDRALTLAAREGYVRVFVDEAAPMAALLHAADAAGISSAYVATLLAAFPTVEGRVPSDQAPPDITDPRHSVLSSQFLERLTERELEVLRLLAAGRSNQAIAQELVVAVGTVKRHVNSIMGKLQAESRLQAVVRARDLGLV